MTGVKADTKAAGDSLSGNKGSQVAGGKLNAGAIAGCRDDILRPALVHRQVLVGRNIKVDD